MKKIFIISGLLFANNNLLSLDPCLWLIGNPPAFAACNVSKAAVIKVASWSAAGKVSAGMASVAVGGAISSAVSSDEPKPAAAPRPAAAPKSNFVAPAQPEKVRVVYVEKPSNSKPANTPQRPPDSPKKPSGNGWRDAAIVSAGVVGGLVVRDMAGTINQRIANDAYDKLTGKAAAMEREKLEEIERRAEERAEQRLMHCTAAEQNYKLQIRIGGLEAKLDEVFVCKE